MPDHSLFDYGFFRGALRWQCQGVIAVSGLKTTFSLIPFSGIKRRHKIDLKRFSSRGMLSPENTIYRFN